MTRTGTVGIEPTHTILSLPRMRLSQGATSTVFQSRFMFQTGFARIERATALNI